MESQGGSGSFSVGDSVGASGGVGETASRGIPGWARVGIVLVALAAAVGFLLYGSDNPFVYSKLVHEVMADPGAFEGRTLRVEGELRQGSIQFREEPCEWRFVIQKEGKELPVRFPQCVVPDTFRDGFGIDVTVQGSLESDGTFLANQVIPRCPSKYEMQQRQQAGEKPPYEMPGHEGIDPAAVEGAAKGEGEVGDMPAPVGEVPSTGQVPAH